MNYEIRCDTPDDTEALGERLGKQLRGGEVIELVGDVGSGKTTLIRGMAKGLDSPDHVSSPTFVVSKVYNGRLVLHHYDLYRLDEPGLVAHELLEILDENANAIIAIEWADSVTGILPDQKMIIRFKARSSEQRVLDIFIPQAQDYITC